MTLRELLKSLQAQDEKSLDMSVLISPPEGGYGEISHVSALYVGRVVIHLAEPQSLAEANREVLKSLKPKEC